MRKIAIFSEGQTEQIFVAEAVKFLAAQHHFFITKEKLHGGKRFPTLTFAVGPDEGDIEDCDFYFLLVDCANDGRVVSAISERYEGLLQQGFDTIIGMRDLAPSFGRDQLQKLLDGASASLPNEPLVPLLVIAVMEVEAWFIAENTHFARMDESLNRDRILLEAGIDVADDASLLDRPSHRLPEIYALAGLSYGKSREEVTRTVSALDFAEYRVGAAFERAGSVRPLFDCLGSIFEEPPAG